MRHWKDFLKDEAGMQALGKALARVLAPGLSLHLHGDLGAGKTFLTRALLHAAGHEGRVKSPTYTLVEPYTITLEGRSIELMHFDLYRMGSPEEFIEAGFREHFGAGKVCVVEWPEQAAGLIPAAEIDVFLSAEGEGRAVELRANSDLGESCLEKLYLSPNL
jgi:tRNA threonylcarbamoyladenosine biosynthesis protein TsaE